MMTDFLNFLVYPLQCNIYIYSILKTYFRVHSNAYIYFLQNTTFNTHIFFITVDIWLIVCSSLVQEYTYENTSDFDLCKKMPTLFYTLNLHIWHLLSMYLPSDYVRFMETHIQKLSQSHPPSFLISKST
jgi:hypothetical protein